MCDIFAIDNELKYINDPEHLPPYIDIKNPIYKDYKELKKIDIAALSNFKLELPEHLPFDERLEEYVDISNHYPVE